MARLTLYLDHTIHDDSLKKEFLAPVATVFFKNTGHTLFPAYSGVELSYTLYVVFMSIALYKKITSPCAQLLNAFSFIEKARILTLYA
jgi:hypothetical protein